MLESRYGPVHLLLDIIRHGRRHAVDIHLVREASFRLDKDLVPVVVRKFDHFIFDGRTVSGADTLDNSCINRRPADVPADDFVCLPVGISEPARNLLDLHIFRVRRVGEGNDFSVPLLNFHFRIVKRPAVHAGRCSCLEPAEVNAFFLQRIRQIRRALHSGGTGFRDGFAHQTAGLQISTRADDNRFAFIHRAGKSFDAGDMARILRTLDEKICHFGLAEVKIRLRLEHLPHRGRIGGLVRLCAERMDSGPL